MYVETLHDTGASGTATTQTGLSREFREVGPVNSPTAEASSPAARRHGRRGLRLRRPEGAPRRGPHRPRLRTRAGGSYETFDGTWAWAPRASDDRQLGRRGRPELRVWIDERARRGNGGSDRLREGAERRSEHPRAHSGCPPGRDSHEVLFVGYANDLALDEALRSKRAVLWSASRDELWTKGATSGDVLD